MSKTFDQLPPKKQKYVKARAEGMSKKAAALKAGYSQSMASSVSHAIETQDVRTAFAELIQRKISAEKIADRIDAGLDAIETKFFQKDGEVVERVDVIAWSERRLYAALAAEFGGYFIPPRRVEAEIGGMKGKPIAHAIFFGSGE
jgi:hypothetical protein